MSTLNQSFREMNNSSGCLGGYCRENPSHPSPSALLGHPKPPNDPHHFNEHKKLLTGDDQQKKQEMDTMLSEAFKILSFEERKEQQEELHGVADHEIAEEAHLVESSLRELEIHLNQVKSGSLYEKAETMDAGYVHARTFRINFLRAERYNAKAAARRMLRFFDEKQKLFGTYKLTKDITIDDLDEDDIKALKGGGIQWAGRDRSNGPIFLQIPGLRKFRSLQNELRARYFIMMEGCKSPEAQLQGIVVFCYTVGNFKDCRQGEGYLENTRLAEALPLYIAAFHFACDNMAEYLFGKAAVAIMPAHLRARFRLHCGSHLECRYLLSSYGIPAEFLPFSPERDSIDLEPHLRWCQKYISEHGHDTARTSNQLVASSSSSARSAVIKPNPRDVLSAGSKKSDNAGNERLRVLVKESLEDYRSGSNDAKRQIVDRITSEIHEAGGRFLHQEKGKTQGWKELSVSNVRLKLTQRFRNHTRRRETARQQAREGNLIADTPRPHDVLLGRGHKSLGTTFLHHLIKEKYEEYESLDRKMKVVVVDEIIERIKSKGGRFLQPSTLDTGGYVELSTDSARDRISTYFRNYRRSSKNMAVSTGL